LSKKGWDYKKLTELVLAGETPTPEMIAKLTAQEELKSWKQQQEEAQLKDAEEAAKARDQKKTKKLLMILEQTCKTTSLKTAINTSIAVYSTGTKSWLS
jgi:hypothetical protein